MAYEPDDFEIYYSHDAPEYFKQDVKNIRTIYKRCDKGNYYTVGLALLINQAMDSWAAATSQNTTASRIMSYVSPALGGAFIITIGIFNLVKGQKATEIKDKIILGTNLGYFKSVPPVTFNLDEKKDIPQDVWMTGLGTKAKI